MTKKIDVTPKPSHPKIVTKGDPLIQKIIITRKNKAIIKKNFLTL